MHDGGAGQVCCAVRPSAKSFVHCAITVVLHTYFEQPKPKTFIARSPSVTYQFLQSATQTVFQSWRSPTLSSRQYYNSNMTSQHRRDVCREGLDKVLAQRGRDGRSGFGQVTLRPYRDPCRKGPDKIPPEAYRHICRRGLYKVASQPHMTSVEKVLTKSRHNVIVTSTEVLAESHQGHTTRSAEEVWARSRHGQTTQSTWTVLTKSRHTNTTTAAETALKKSRHSHSVMSSEVWAITDATKDRSFSGAVQFRSWLSSQACTAKLLHIRLLHVLADNSPSRRLLR